MRGLLWVLLVGCGEPEDSGQAGTDDTGIEDTGTDDTGTEPTRLRVDVTADGASVSCQVLLDGVAAGDCGAELDVASGSYSLTVGDPADLSADGLPVVRAERAWIAPSRTVVVPSEPGLTTVAIALNAYVDTALSCQLATGYHHDAECDGNDEPVTTWEGEADVTFRVVGGDTLEITVDPEGAVGSQTLEVDGLKLRSPSDATVQWTRLDDEAVVLRTDDIGDCPDWTTFDCS